MQKAIKILVIPMFIVVMSIYIRDQRIAFKEEQNKIEMSHKKVQYCQSDNFN